MIFFWGLVHMCVFLFVLALYYYLKSGIDWKLLADCFAIDLSQMELRAAPNRRVPAFDNVNENKSQNKKAISLVSLPRRKMYSFIETKSFSTSSHIQQQNHQEF